MHAYASDEPRHLMRRSQYGGRKKEHNEVGVSGWEAAPGGEAIAKSTGCEASSVIACSSRRCRLS